jgi:hypothetical protein
VTPRRNLVLGLLVAIALLGQAATAAAQGGSITGTVTNKANNQPIAGAQILLVNTRIGGLTDAQGRYTIANVPAGTYIVSVTFLGYAEARQPNVVVRAGQAATANFQLDESVLSLRQLVVTGVSDPTSGVKLPFSVAKVSADQLQVGTQGSALEMISGKVAGAYVIRRAETRPDAEIQLRSPTSFETSSRPLFVIDGVVVATDNMGRETRPDHWACSRAARSRTSIRRKSKTSR